MSVIQRIDTDTGVQISFAYQDVNLVQYSPATKRMVVHLSHEINFTLAGVDQAQADTFTRRWEDWFHGGTEE